ncbi:MAG TPA: POTRA domain-containing protein [Puia sp.]|nr:POTRA domain-containing protein [Puia sp.]
MINRWKYYCLIIFGTTLFFDVQAQILFHNTATGINTVFKHNDPLQLSSVNHQNPFIIGNIYINGNKKTKTYIILRELTFKKGDTISLPELVKAFELGHDRLINTLLFTNVIVSLKGFRGYIVDVQIDVIERWYIIPVPYFHPVDRNLTVWQEHNYSLNRVNYGLKYTQNNFSGRNDNMVLWLITGYSRQAEIAYDQPYADASLKNGFGFTIIYIANKEFDAMTKNNQQYFINADTLGFAGKYLSEEFRLSLRYYYRPALTTRHTIRLNFDQLKIDTAVRYFNPHYLNNNKKQVFYPELSYQMDYTNVDYIAYPLKGVAASAVILKKGINADMNLWQLNLQSIESAQLAHKTYFSTQNMATVKLPFDQPFYTQQLFGYGNFYLRGLEKYVIDGVAGFAMRNTFLREITSFSLPIKIPFLGLYEMPFRVMAKTYSDMGYIYNKTTDLSNSLSKKFLYTEGFGIDIVTAYDFIFRIEYSFNQLGQNGLFLHIHNDF